MLQVYALVDAYVDRFAALDHILVGIRGSSEIQRNIIATRGLGLPRA